MALRVHAEAVEWGGEVYSARVGTNPHTKTGMGSGQFPDFFGDSGLIKRIRIHDNSAELKFPEWVETYTDEFNCYDVDYVSILKILSSITEGLEIIPSARNHY